MKIGLDVDGVLTNMQEYQLKYGKKYFLKKNPNLEINENGYDICDIFHCSKEEREKFWTKYIWKYCLMPNRKDVSEMVARFHAEGHEVHIITGRAHTTESGMVGKLFRKMLIWRLKKDGIKYDSIHFVSESESAKDKVEICKQLGIDVMVDDKKENIEALDGIAKCICFDCLYNKQIKSNNFTRVNNIGSVYEETENIARIIKKERGEDTFQILSHEERKDFSKQQQEEYFIKLRDFYSKLPYNSKLMKKQERRYKLVATIGIPILKVALKPNIFNSEALRTNDGVIYVSNHLNYYDQFPIISAIGTKPIHFLTATKMLKLKRGFFYRLTGAVSVDRENKSDRKRATEDVEKILINGGTVFIFPEGRTNREKTKINQFQPGAVAIAQATGKAIVPIAITDDYRRGKICIRAGEHIYVKPDDDVIRKTKELQDIVEGLIDENTIYKRKKEKTMKKI